MPLYYPRARAILQVILDGFGDTAQNSEVLVIPVIPRSQKIHVNPYNEPDEWEITIDAKDLPIDPQMVKTGAVELYLYDAGSIAEEDQLQNRQTGALDGPVTSAESLALEIGASKAKKAFVGDRRPRIVGLFDDQEMNLSRDENIVTIKGQDYTAVLKGMQWRPQPNGRARRIPVGKRLDLWARDILAEADGSAAIEVALDGVEASDLPLVGKEDAKTNKYGIPVGQDTSYWDVLTKIVNRSGFLCHMRGLDFVITRPHFRNLEEIKPRRIAWGQNLETLKFVRHLGKQKVPQIIIKSYHPETRQTITVAYPEKVAEVPVGTIGSAQSEFLVVPVYGIVDKRVLISMAENLFQVIGKGERRIIATTGDMTDLDGANMLELLTGDPVSVEYTGFSRSEFLGLTHRAQKVQYLVARGYNTSVASALAEHHDLLLGNAKPLRLHSATYDWDSATGLRIEIELQDFVVLDVERVPSSGQKGRKDKLQDDKGQSLRNPLIQGKE